MATWYDTTPTAANQVLTDITRMREMFDELESVIETISGLTLGTDEPTNFVVAGGKVSGGRPVVTGLNNGSYNVDMPTNDMAAAKFMTGDSSTIAWFYLNTGPPGWKVLATGTDSVLAISGGSQAYNVSGGNPDSSATWTIGGVSVDSHSHALQQDNQIGSPSGTGYTLTSTADANTASASPAMSSDATWRPKASVGKLFQLDTA